MPAHGKDPMLGWSLDGISFSLCSIFVSAKQEQFWLKIFEDVLVTPSFHRGLHLSTGGGVFEFLHPIVGNFCKGHTHWVPRVSYFLDLWYYLEGPHSSLPLRLNISSPPIPDHVLLFPSSSLLPHKSLPSSASWDYFLPHSKWDWNILTWAFLLV